MIQVWNNDVQGRMDAVLAFIQAVIAVTGSPHPQPFSREERRSGSAFSGKTGGSRRQGKKARFQTPALPANLAYFGPLSQRTPIGSLLREKARRKTLSTGLKPPAVRRGRWRPAGSGDPPGYAGHTGHPQTRRWPHHHVRLAQRVADVRAASPPRRGPAPGPTAELAVFDEVAGPDTCLG